MRNQIMKAAIVAMAAGTVLAEMHLPSKGDLALSIPFEFTIGQRTMAAGEYTILAESGGRLRICEDGIRCVTLSTSRVELPGLLKNPTVLFRKGASGWSLVEVWTMVRAGHRVSAGGSADWDCQNVPEYTEIIARTLCVHRTLLPNRTGGAATSWH